jgi:hypothetical protein
MSILHNSGRQPVTRWVSDAVPWLQGTAGGVGPAVTLPARGDAGGVRPAARQHTWPGRDFGIRAPYPRETPLSWDEVHHAIAHRLI